MQLWETRNKRKTAEAERDTERFRTGRVRMEARIAKATPSVRAARLQGILVGLAIAAVLAVALILLRLLWPRDPVPGAA